MNGDLGVFFAYDFVVCSIVTPSLQILPHPQTHSLADEEVLALVEVQTNGSLWQLGLAVHNNVLLC